MLLFKQAQEQKQEFDQALRKCKTNEKILNGEIDHLRRELEKNNAIPDKEEKEKEIKGLNLKIKEVSNWKKQNCFVSLKIYFLKIKERNEDFKRSNEKVLLDLNANLKTKDLNIEELQNEINNQNK